MYSMNQEKAVNAVYRDLILHKLVKEEDETTILQCLNALFLAGTHYKNGRPLLNSGKPISCYDRKGNKLGEWNNAPEACRELGITHVNTIYRSVWLKRFTKRGQIWKYEDKNIIQSSIN